MFRVFLLKKRYYSTSTVSIRECFVEYAQGAQEGIAMLNLNRSHARNAMGRQLMKELNESMDEVSRWKEKDAPKVRVVIIRSLVENIFCAGADLKERAMMNKEEVDNCVSYLRSSLSRLEELSLPTIAALDGTALGGGLEMALACDFRCAGPKAKMGLVETSLGLIPGAGGTQRLPRLIGASKAKELIMTARILNSHQAKEYGIVNELSGTSGFDAAMILGTQILSNAPIAVHMAKRAINHGIQLPIQEAMKLEKECYNVIIPTEDRLEGLAAFKEKRRPVFQGR